MNRSKYESHIAPNLEKIEQWAKKGATSKDIAKKLHIGYTTMRNYILAAEGGDERYRGLMDAFARGCQVSDDEIETALFKRARGMEYTERTVERVLNKRTMEYEEVCTKQVTRYYPPDPTSCMFWLTNRRPDRWQYRRKEQEAETSEGTGVVVIPPVMDNPGPPEVKPNA